jgi:hypothetical protein
MQPTATSKRKRDIKEIRRIKGQSSMAKENYARLNSLREKLRKKT